jgi:hypothetical protein
MKTKTRVFVNLHSLPLLKIWFGSNGILTDSQDASPLGGKGRMTATVFNSGLEVLKRPIPENKIEFSLPFTSQKLKHYETLPILANNSGYDISLRISGDEKESLERKNFSL